MNRPLIITGVILAGIITMLTIENRKTKADIQAIQDDLESIKKTTSFLSEFYRTSLNRDAASVSSAIYALKDFSENTTEPISGEALYTVQTGIFALENAALKYGTIEDDAEIFLERLTTHAVGNVKPRDQLNAELYQYVLETLALVKQTEALGPNYKYYAHGALSDIKKMIETSKTMEKSTSASQ